MKRNDPTNTFGSIWIKGQSDTLASDRCIIVVYLRVFAIWGDNGSSLIGLGILCLTPSTTGYFFEMKFYSVILFSITVIFLFAWNLSNTIKVKSVLWLLMAWCFSARAAVATVLITHTCVSSCLWVNKNLYCWSAHPFITRGQFWPSGIVVACVCVCVCACVCPSIISLSVQ